MLHAKAVIISPSINFWSKWRKSTKAQQDAAMANHAAISAISARKNLVQALDTEYKEVQTRRNAMYQVARRFGAMWASGQYLLPHTVSLKFFEEWGAAKEELEQAAEKFFTAYEAFYRNMQVSSGFASGLGDLHNSSEYPTPEAMRSTLRIRLDISSVPESGDIRVEGFTEEEKQKLVEMGKASYADNMARIMVSHLKKLQPVVQTMAETLAGDTKFRQSLLDNLKQTLALVRDLNVTESPKVEQLCRACEAVLLQHDRQRLLDDVAARQDTASKAQQLAQIMSTAISTLDPDNGEE